jgi:hypothetical protein
MDERLDELDKDREQFANECATDNQRLDARFDQVRLSSPARAWRLVPMANLPVT